MHFYEFEAKRLLAKHGIPIPESTSAETPADVERGAAAIGFPVVLKAQVLARALGPVFLGAPASAWAMEAGDAGQACEVRARGCRRLRG